MTVLRCRPFLTSFLAALASLASVASAQPAAAPATRPATAATTTSADVELHEWLVLVCDRNQPQANGRTAFRSTLPSFVGTRRPAAEAEQRGDPQPVGVIRLLGDSARSAAAAEKIDVLLEMKSGTFVAHWPKARTKPNRVLWQNIELGPLTGGNDALDRVDAGHWFTALRRGPAPLLAIDGRGERFLVYDVELNYPPPLRIAAGSGKTTYQVGNTATPPLSDLVLYKNVGGTWHAGGLERLVTATRPATTQPTTQAGSGAAATTAAADARSDAAAAARLEAVARTTAALQAAAAAASSGAPVEAPATQPATSPSSTQPAFVGTDVALAPVGADVAALLAPWRQKLSAAGLVATDHDLILRVLEKHALDPKRLTAIYRLDAGELDRLLPLDVTPTPRKTVRVALVVVRGIDPAITDEIDGLITQLGDADWNVREAAYKQLAEFGAAAQPKLTEATRQKDLEVVYRAERLLQRLANPAAANPP